MNDSNFYELGLVLSTVILLVLLIFIFIYIYIYIDIEHNKLNNIKRSGIITTIALLCLGIATFCYINIKKSYKEVYYLEYTVYYPGNTCKFKVDSCNHIYASSDRGTNHIRYYSIPKRDTYGTDTTAPIVINKIIKIK
jgi:hypothetical protein